MKIQPFQNKTKKVKRKTKRYKKKQKLKKKVKKNDIHDYKQFVVEW